MTESKCSTCQDARWVGGFLPAPCPSCVDSSMLGRIEQLERELAEMTTAANAASGIVRDDYSEMKALRAQLAAARREDQRDAALTLLSDERHDNAEAHRNLEAQRDLAIKRGNDFADGLLVATNERDAAVAECDDLRGIVARLQNDLLHRDETLALIERNSAKDAFFTLANVMRECRDANSEITSLRIQLDAARDDANTIRAQLAACQAALQAKESK